VPGVPSALPQGLLRAAESWGFGGARLAPAGSLCTGIQSRVYQSPMVHNPSRNQDDTLSKVGHSMHSGAPADKTAEWHLDCWVRLQGLQPTAQRSNCDN
jgi:hypothetical protein